MAQKQTEKKEQEHKPAKKTVIPNGFIDLVAFIALGAAAVMLVIGPILGWILEQTGGQVIMQALSLVAHWKIAYFIFLAVYVAGTILGVTVGI